MKFICKKCIQDGISQDPCILDIKNAKNLDYDRPWWERALRRCPFEDEDGDSLTGKSPVADWVRK